ncbi:LuxR C-terminal-related transcriptional regulator [Blastococcus sp. VKM Ac-2987]|uniref:LuxR C-terminal-related transcriptional regulator n=1 Tax=Blastococcus sp. VKM Ac-2987 TaxID=3004141 RepID=UPI0022AB561F|nr:LuxR C-terminal-related transcriptional regulator [Blastococcus sp. VKM Ac-2987]MCZ2860826.1 LuxR C-terminal-related transcriptional regulator [Blastococcus sp. VKM Ac-2987]
MGPLLTTKLHVPRRRRGVVARSRLGELLGRGDEAALTLVSAPAGFGKTTLLTEWLAGAEERSIAWLSLDERDDDPVVFWAYLISALQTAVAGVGSSALAVLREPHASMDEVLASLINDLDAVPDDVVLVLDDYHVITARDVHERMALLLERLPPHVHLVIATRADPPLPLARLRARGELVEVRAADLRFTTAETARYLTESMGLALNAEHVAALDARTEGWIAALQLAALSMRGRDDVAGFITGFAGDDRYVVDYLVEEVLQRQPDDVRDFLLQTSILSRLSGPLCDGVVGGDGGTTMLERLDRANLFLVPLDDRRHWYRYHHLFADVLQARLLAERPESIPELHRRAGDWFAENGEPAEAVRHALTGGDPERAADLVELAMPAARQNRQETTLRHWFSQLPEHVLRGRPVLRAGYAGAILVHGELDGVEEHLREAERWLDEIGVRATGGAGAEDAVVRAVRSQVAVYRAAQARLTGDLQATTRHARRVLELAGDDEHLVRGSAAGLLGLAYWTAGDLDDAHRWWTESSAQLRRAGHHSDTLGVSIALADIALARGRLREAETVHRSGLTAAFRHGGSVLRGAADMYVGLSEVALERNELAAAREHLAASAALGDGAGLPQNRHRSRLATARLRAAGGDLDGAVDLLDEAEHVYVGDMFPDVRPIAAVRARMCLARGRVDEAFDWAGKRALSPEDPLSYLHEFEHATLARILLAQHELSGDPTCLTRATELLERLRHVAQEGMRTGSVVQLSVPLALAHRAGGDVPRALATLERALTLAEPEGYVRVFLDEGQAMTSLLEVLATREGTRPYLRRLLAAGPGPVTAAAGRQALVEPLSARELDVLRLLDTDLDGPDIARRLFVSVNTVRTHTKNLYAKLGVNNRRAAVRRGRDLGLLTAAGGRAVSTAVVP